MMSNTRNLMKTLVLRNVTGTVFRTSSHRIPLSPQVVTASPVQGWKISMLRTFCASSGTETDKLFGTMKAKLTDDVKKDINGLMAFEIGGSKWFVDAHPDRPLQVTSDVLPNKPDVTFITDEGTFVKLAKGEVKATNVFMTGKLKIKGNLSIAMKAEKIFKKLA